MKTEDLLTLMDKASKLARTMSDTDEQAYADLTALVAQMAACIDDGTISEEQHGYETVLHFVQETIEDFHLEW